MHKIARVQWRYLGSPRAVSDYALGLFVCHALACAVVVRSGDPSQMVLVVHGLATSVLVGCAVLLLAAPTASRTVSLVVAMMGFGMSAALTLGALDGASGEILANGLLIYTFLTMLLATLGLIAAGVSLSVWRAVGGSPRLQ